MHSKDARRRYHRSLLLSQIAQIRFIRGRSYSFVELGEENRADLQPRDEQLTFHGSEF